VESGDKTLALKLEEHGYAWVADRDPALSGEARA
jgi:Fe-S cluster assembly ATP-binding protein